MSSEIVVGAGTVGFLILSTAIGLFIYGLRNLAKILDGSK